jgi:peptidoglycan/xylan/chitin deacetylase (PgdA/CDA1 family)
MSGASTAKSVAAGLLKVAAAGRDALRPAGAGAVVLLYHRVGRRSSLAVDLPAPLFTAQVDELAAAGRTVSLDVLLSLVAEPNPPAVDPVALTFDDGTEDFADVVLPALDAASAPATLYVATDFVDTGRPFPQDGTPLSWSALRDCLSTGLVTVGSHTHTHALLDRLAPEEVAGELDRSVKLIEDQLGVTPEHFAYPKALLGSTAAQAEVRSRFRSAAVAGTRPNRYGATDPYRLHRSPVQVADGMRWFRHKARGGMAFEDQVRQLVNRRRYEGAVT